MVVAEVIKVAWCFVAILDYENWTAAKVQTLPIAEIARRCTVPYLATLVGCPLSTCLRLSIPSAAIDALERFLITHLQTLPEATRVKLWNDCQRPSA